MLGEGLYYNTLVAAAIMNSQPDSGNDADNNYSNSNYSNNKELNKKSQQGKRQPAPTMNTEKRSDSEQCTAQLLKQIDEQHSTICHLENQIKKSEERSEKVAKRSSDITKCMAKVMETEGNFEDINDGFAKIDIAEKFNNVYDREWANLSRWLAKQFKNISELELIQRLTSLMKKYYKECINLADEQLRQFMFLDESQSTPTPETHKELYAMRRQCAQTDTARSKAKQIVLSKVSVHDEMSCFQREDLDEKTRTLLQEFLSKYIDCCWLMVVSNPPLALNFDVVGKQYCSQHFKVYSAKQRLENDTCDTNTVREVVWPCVYYTDRSLFCKKGDAVLGTKDVNISGDFDATKCTCFTSEEDNPEIKTLNAKMKDTSTSEKGNTSGSETRKQTDIF